jgi:acyl CoA:acetate/3-ketoacid CoA transferase beta subunit
MTFLGHGEVDEQGNNNTSYLGTMMTAPAAS